MSWLRNIRSWIAERGAQRRFRFPALAAANKVLLTVENEITDFSQVSQQMEAFKKAQSIHEKDRDQSYIPIYFSFEEFITSHQPPVIKEPLNVEQVREKVRQSVDLNQLNEQFRLIFLPPNEQADHFLKIGALDLLRFLLTSLGKAQLISLLKDNVGNTALEAIEVNDDGISFENAHKRAQLFTKDEVVSAYQKLYKALYSEVKNLFGEKAAMEIVSSTRQKIEHSYSSELVSLFINTLPEEARS